MNARAPMLGALAVAVLYVGVLAYPVHLHVVGTVSDFYLRFAPDADRIARGKAPQNTYNPPGYPILLTLVSMLSGDHFTSGKWMSLFAGGLTGVLAFVLVRRLFGRDPALLTVPLILSSAVFTRYAITAMSDVPFVCVCVLAMIAITGDGPPLRRAILSGGLCGIACLIRYNGVFLLLPGLAAATWGRRSSSERVRSAAAFLVSFFLIVSPWLWANYHLYGSPFFATNHEDVARLMRVSGPFGSIAEVVLQHPILFARTYASNLARNVANTLGASLALLPVGPLAAAGIVLSLARDRRKPVLLVLLAALSFLLLMALTHWETRYYFFILVCWGGFAAYTIVETGRWVGRRLDSRLAASATMAALALMILCPSSAAARRETVKTLSRQPVELLPAARFLESVAPPGATVMSIRAQIAYLSRRNYQPVPAADSAGALEALILARPPSYLVYDRWARFLPSFQALANPAATPPWLEAVYRQPSIVIYRVARAAPSVGAARR